MAEPSTVVRGARVADPESPHRGQTVDVVLSDAGVVLAIEPSGKGVKAPKSATEISADSQVIAPALADVWTHLPDPGYETRATLTEVAAEAYAGGYADLLAMPTTLPVLDRAEALRGLLGRTLSLPVRIHASGALTLGAKGSDLAELLDLAAAGARAFTDAERPVQHPGVLLRALQYAQLTGLPVLQTPLDALLAAGHHAADTPANTRLGFRGMPPLSETLALARDLDVLTYGSTPVHFSPITTAQGVDRIREAKARGLRVTASTSPVYLTLDDTSLRDFDTRYHVSPPLRTAADRAALVAALADGTLDLVASHHTPLTLEEKDLEWDYSLPGASCLGSAFAVLYPALVGFGAMTLDTLIDRLAHAPRRLLGLPLQRVERGADRLVLIDPQAAVTGAPTHEGWQAHTWPFESVSRQGLIRPLW